MVRGRESTRFTCDGRHDRSNLTDPKSLRLVSQRSMIRRRCHAKALMIDPSSIAIDVEAIDRDRSTEEVGKFFSDRRDNLLTLDFLHAIDSVDMNDWIVECDLRRRISHRIDCFFHSIEKRSPPIFFQTEIKSALIRAVPMRRPE